MLFDGLTAISMVWDDCDEGRRGTPDYVHRSCYWTSKTTPALPANTSPSVPTKFSFRHSLLVLIFMGLKDKGFSIFLNLPDLPLSSLCHLWTSSSLDDICSRVISMQYAELCDINS